MSQVPAELEAVGAGRAVEVVLSGGAKLVITEPGQSINLAVL